MLALQLDLSVSGILSTISTDTSLFAINERFFTYRYSLTVSINRLKSIISVDYSIAKIIETCSHTCPARVMHSSLYKKDPPFLLASNVVYFLVVGLYSFWPTVLSVEPLVQCLVCLSSVRRPSVTFCIVAKR